MRYFIDLSYNGKNYSGWQKQPNATTIQQVLEEAISVVSKMNVELTGCGRTDAGVNASKFFAHFDTDITLDETTCNTITAKLNGYLDKDIVIRKIFPVADDLHARFSAKSRTYQYFITTKKNPFKQNFHHLAFNNLDVNLMNEACSKLCEYTDFTAFAKLHSQTNTNNCKIMKAVWIRKDEDIIFTIQADRFLRNMVRAIVGTMIEVGEGRISIEDFCKVIEGKNRCEAGTSVPAHALFLTDVRY